jgi:putative glutamine amidotransferase
MTVYIGIPSRILQNGADTPKGMGVRVPYIEAITNSGGTPFLIPLLSDEAILRNLYELADGILLAGGEDVDPAHYGESPHDTVNDVDTLRDSVELKLARWCANDKKPLLGICRGMQVLNVALGGSLYQDLPSEKQESHSTFVEGDKDSWIKRPHELILKKDSKLADYLGVTCLEVNTLHHQAVKKVAKGLKAVGETPSGIIEAVEGENHPFCIGIQCHPEMLYADVDKRWGGVFNAFVQEAGHIKSGRSLRQAV